MIESAPIRARFTSLSGHLDERGRRVFAATEASAAGYGGVAAVSRATGIAVSTIGRGLKELNEAAALTLDRIRRPGGGRKPLDRHRRELAERSTGAGRTERAG